MLHEKVRNWIREQPEYSEYTVKTITLEELDALTEVFGVSLWSYVLTWDKAVQISSDNYIAQSMEHCNSINCIEFDALFAIDSEAHCIYQPYLEVAECGKMETFPFEQTD